MNATKNLRKYFYLKRWATGTFRYQQGSENDRSPCDGLSGVQAIS